MHAARTHFFFILSLALLGGCGLFVTEDEQARLDFLESYQAAQQSHDVEKILEHYYWEGVEESYQRMVRFGLQTEAQYDLAAISIGPLEESDFFGYTVEGQRYEPNLEPVCTLHLEYDIPERLNSTFVLGKKDGRYWVINPRPVGASEVLIP